MKATGIVRRIDDLGRVVIPKELRRTMRLREGAPLEIFTDRDGTLIFKEYSPLGELTDFAADLCESLRRATEATAAVCDREGVIAAAGPARKELLGKPVGQELDALLASRALHRASDKPVGVPEGSELCALSVAAPILCEGDVVGGVLFAGGARVCGETEEKLALAAAHFLGRQMEG